MIVTVTGSIGAGETTFSDILEKRGFRKISLSDILREKLREMGKPVIRENLRELGDKLREEHGKEALAKLAWEKMKSGGDWVVDSVMALEEAEFLKGKGAHTAGITAPDMVRYERIKARGDEFSSFEEFIKVDNHDKTVGVDTILENADFLISNDGTVEDLEEVADLIIKTISSSPSQI